MHFTVFGCVLRLPVSQTTLNLGDAFGGYRTTYPSFTSLSSQVLSDESSLSQRDTPIGEVVAKAIASLRQVEKIQSI